MWLRMRMFLLVAVLFGILYGVITGVGTWMGAGSAITYIILAFTFLGIQYLLGPSMVAWVMRVKWVSEQEAPELHLTVADLAEKAHLPKPGSAFLSWIFPTPSLSVERSETDGSALPGV